MLPFNVLLLSGRTPEEYQEMLGQASELGEPQRGLSVALSLAHDFQYVRVLMVCGFRHLGSMKHCAEVVV